MWRNENLVTGNRMAVPMASVCQGLSGSRLDAYGIGDSIVNGDNLHWVKRV